MQYNDACKLLAGEQGLKIFPCQSNKIPYKDFKWKEEASSDQGKLNGWAQAFDPVYAGIPTGQDNNLLVIDIDVKDGKDGTAQFKNWLNGRELPKTVTARSPSGGWHLYFKYPKGTSLTVGQNKPVSCVDYRGEGGYIVAYNTLPGQGWGEIELAEAPDYLIEALSSPANDKPAVKLGELYDDRGYRIDGRDEYAAKLIYSLYQKHGPNADLIMDIGYERYYKACGGDVYDLEAEKRGRSFFFDKVKYIIERGVEIKEDASDLSDAAPAFGLIKAESVVPDLDASDFVEGLLSDGGLSVVYGPPASGKTFFVADIGMRVALGEPWRGQEVEQGPVIYAALEAQKGINNRIAAWKQYNNRMDDLNIPFEYCTHGFSLLNEHDVRAFIKTTQDAGDRWEMPVRMVIVDTLSRAFMGGDENLSSDMTTFISHVDAIKQETGAHVCVVHHCGKDVEKGMRGHSSLKGAVDTEIAIAVHGEDTRDDNIRDMMFHLKLNGALVRQMMVVKQKEMETIADVHFKLNQVNLGMKVRYGVQTSKPMTSCVVSYLD